MNLKKEVSVAKIAKDAEDLFRGGFFCSEAVVSSIRSNFEMDVPEEVIAMASGFPIGIGRSKCLCGAVSGGVMAIGLVFGRTVQIPRWNRPCSCPRSFTTGSRRLTERTRCAAGFSQKNLTWGQGSIRNSVSALQGWWQAR